MAEKESKASSTLTTESVKVIAESTGIGGLPDKAATYLAEDCTYRLKQVVQVWSYSNMFIGKSLDQKRTISQPAQIQFHLRISTPILTCQH